MSDIDDWVTSAITNTELVVNLLLKLREKTLLKSSLHKNWSTTQPRSLPNKKLSDTRDSPTTPLSYSTCEESSHVIHNGSKIIGPNETTPTKRPRKKKTLAELKEDETTLMKERKQLKRHLATLQDSCQKQRTENENLKKMKIDLQSRYQGFKASKVNACMQGKKNGFVLPDLNIPAGEEY